MTTSTLWPHFFSNVFDILKFFFSHRFRLVQWRFSMFQLPIFDSSNSSPNPYFYYLKSVVNIYVTWYPTLCRNPISNYHKWPYVSRRQTKPRVARERVPFPIHLAIVLLLLLTLSTSLPLSFVSSYFILFGLVLVTKLFLKAPSSTIRLLLVSTSIVSKAFL